jgi:hypothetical protein
MSLFKKAVRSRRKLRAAFDGPAGSGKTFTALRLAFSLVQAGMAKSVAVIDTENESASLYAGEAPDGVPWDFASMNLKQFGPDQFSYALNTAVNEGFDCVVIDSLSHAWIGEGGALDLVDSKGGNKFTAWKDITPLQRKMVDTIIRCNAHVLATMRSKTEYILEEQVNAHGKTVQVPVKKGMAPIQRDGLEYEFDLYGSIDQGSQLRITKSRCSLMHGQTAIKPGPQFWKPLLDWLQSAEPTPVVKEGQKAVELAEQIGRARNAEELDLIKQAAKDAIAHNDITDAEATELRALWNLRLAAVNSGTPTPLITQ